MQGRVLGGRYRLLSPLGQGGMGAVWRAQQLDLPRPVAIKVIHPGEAGAAQNRVRFEREARAAAELTSLHIVDITDYGIDNDTPYIVMKLLEGESLAARLLRRGKLPFEDTVCLLSQVAKALTLAHEKRIVHRDLKPENVFIEGYQPGEQGTPGNPEVVKVLDFGIAKILDAKSLGSSVGTCTEAPIGTPYYMSPEQIIDSSSVDHRTDIWSFGVMAYQCVTGRRPFDASSLALLWDAIRGHAAKPPSEVVPVPTGFDEWFAQATACKLDERFGSIKEAGAQLCALQDRRSLAEAKPAATDPKRILTVTTEVPEVSDPLPAPKDGPPDFEKEAKAGVSPIDSLNTVDPSSVTAPRTQKGASLRRVAAATLVIGGAVSAIGYLALARQNADTSGAPMSPSAFAATPVAAQEVARSEPSAQEALAEREIHQVTSLPLEPTPIAPEASGVEPVDNSRGSALPRASTSARTSPRSGPAQSKDSRRAGAKLIPATPVLAQPAPTQPPAKSGVPKPASQSTRPSGTRAKALVRDAPF